MPSNEKNPTYLLAPDPPSEQRRKEPMPAQMLLDFLQCWNKPIISTREIRIYGPKSLRDRESAISAVEILVRRGWLVELKARQRNWHQWQIVRKPTVYPIVAA
jgi:hypothetical protein